MKIPLIECLNDKHGQPKKLFLDGGEIDIKKVKAFKYEHNSGQFTTVSITFEAQFKTITEEQEGSE